jgi:hypothetical protein
MPHVSRRDVSGNNGSILLDLPRYHDGMQVLERMEDERYEIWWREAKSAFTDWRYNNEKDNIR